MAFLLKGGAISEVWRSSLELFLNNPNLHTYPGPGGELCYELENVVMEVEDPTLEPRLPELYAFPGIQKLLESVTTKKTGDVKTIYDRLYAWDQSHINQIADVKKLLKKNISTRHGVVSIWNPQIDLKSGKPPCPIMFQFLVRDDRLNMTCVIRSTDAWLGAIADMLTFTGIQAKLARDLKVQMGSYVHHSVSYHLYDYHYLQVSQLLSP